MEDSFKQTVAGRIPREWEVKPLADITEPQRPISYGIVQTGPTLTDGIPCLRVLDIDNGQIKKGDLVKTSKLISDAYKRTILKEGDLVMPLRGKVGDVGIIDRELEGANLTRGVALIAVRSPWSGPFCRQLISWSATRRRLEQTMNGSALQEIPIAALRSFQVGLPSSLPEQQAIAKALGDVDGLIASLEALIAKKRDIKQGAMQELLSGHRRLPGFTGEWEAKTLEQTMDCFDNLRVPLNDRQRAGMKGDYPYCGANGVVDFIDRYLIDDDIILIAEDGGYFDEYMTRPIAYRMIGKSWVNNHAHVLKVKDGNDQAFFYYSLVHKNVMGFLASGTRAKLNKSEMWKIVVTTPATQDEQVSVAGVLSDMDIEIAALEAKLAKTRDVKQGMMQVLLTGEVRLI